MPDEPLIFVEVALCNGVPGSIQAVLADGRDILVQDQVDTAVFYSISNCQEGLRGVSFGNSLIKQVVEDLSNEFPHLARFITLSPIPGLTRWLAEQPLSGAQSGEKLRIDAARYLLEAKRPDGTPLDSVARFHLGNGASVHDVHSDADLSENGMRQSHGAMVNYLYDLKRLEPNIEAYFGEKRVAASPRMQALLKGAQREARKG
jgi:malonyl-CoA decarboxylase